MPMVSQTFVESDDFCLMRVAVCIIAEDIHWGIVPVNLLNLQDT